MRSPQWIMVLGVAVLALSLSGGAVLAEQMNKEETSLLVVRAWGDSGSSVKNVRRSEQQQPEQTLGRDVQAGVIPRAALQAELSLGIGRFLQQVRTQPVVSRGRFVGWRLMTLFPSRSDVRVAVLRPGDTLLRINGQSVERPEEFKALWDSMADAKELVLDIIRDGQASSLHYGIR